MARIPMGEFGNALPTANPTALASTAQLDGGLAAATQRLGETGMAIGAQAVEQGRARAEAELRRVQELRERTQSTRAMGEIANDTRDIGDQLRRDVAAGTVKPDDAGREYDKLMDRALRARLDGLAPHMAEAVKAGAVERVGSGRNLVVDAAVKQTQQLVRSDMAATGEALERNALENRPGAVQQFQNLMVTMGPEAGLDPAQIGKEVQAFRERTSFNLGAALVRSARDNPADLEAVQKRLGSQEFADLAPERMGQLEGQILARKSHLEAKEATRIARAEAAAARRDRQADAAVKSAQSFIDGGGVPDENFTAQLTARVAGTAYAPVLNQMLRTAGQDASFAKQTPREQEATLVEMRSKAAGNPAQMKRIDHLQRIASETRAQLDSDPLSRAAATGIVQIQPLNFANVDQLGAQLAQRVDAAATASARYGRAVPPLTKQEAAAAADMLGKLPGDVKMAAIGMFARALPPQQMQAFGAQVGGQDSAIGTAMFAAAQGRTNTAGLILRAEDARKAGRLTDDEVSNADKRRIAKEYDAVPWPTPQARDAAVLAAQRAYDGMRDKSGSANWREAIKNVTGELAEWNDSKVPMPEGWTQRRFTRAVASSTTPDKLAQAAGGQELRLGATAVPVSTFSKGMSSVRLMPAGDGRFALEAGGQLVLRADGQLLRIKVED